LDFHFFGAIPSDRIRKATKDVSVHLFTHMFTFRDELLMDSATAVENKIFRHKLSFILVDWQFFASKWR
jgi:hypothetical protein